MKASIKSNSKNPVNEALWGSPGTVIPALRIGDAALIREGAEYFFRPVAPSLALDCSIWTQDLYGQMRELIGASHGFSVTFTPYLRASSF